MSSPNETPSAAEFGQLRAYLAGKGFSQSWINEQIPDPSSMTRSDIAETLKTAMRELPHE